MSADLERVREYRRAARMAVRADDATLHSRYLALIDLAEAARAEPGRLVATWSERAIWEESKRFLGVDDEDHLYPPEPYEAAHRRLRARGLVVCPECLSDLATEADFERWHQMRADHIDELRLREEAIDG